MGHGHGLPHHHAAGASSGQVRRLAVALVLALAFLVVEVVVGITTSSLALWSDAAHMATDALGLGMALTAAVVSGRVAAARNRTFGLYRAEVLAALANAVLLFGVAGYVLSVAVRRFAEPPVVPGLPVAFTAVAGIVVNVAAMVLLHAGSGESLAVRGAYLEVLSDLVASVGVLVSGLVTLVFGWRYADPVVGVAIGLFVLPRTWQLARQALRILFQHAPDRLDVREVAAELGGLSGVREVHDLHVWTLASGMEVASAHLTTDSGVDPARVLLTAQRLLDERYHIEHATLQVEPHESAGRCRQVAW